MNLQYELTRLEYEKVKEELEKLSELIYAKEKQSALSNSYDHIKEELKQLLQSKSQKRCELEMLQRLLDKMEITKE
jgi:hypothetical protein